MCEHRETTQQEHICSASTVQSLTQHTNLVHTGLANINCISLIVDQPTMPHKVCRWLMAAGKRPVPFRTRKLSPPAPMVLPPGGSGRVGYRRPNNFTHNTRCTTRPLCSGCFFICQARTHPAILRIADNHHLHPPLVHTHETPGRDHPAGRDPPTRGHIGRGASTRGQVPCSGVAVCAFGSV